MSVSLHVEQLRCQRREHWLFQPISFEVLPEQSLQICGANGTGKTTVLHCLLGLHPLSSGRMSWQGAESTPSICYIGHQTGLKLQLSVWENFYYQAQLHARYSVTQLEQALRAVQLLDASDQPSYQLSAGQQRRLHLALLTLSSAFVWMLDEPLTALDHAGQQWLCERMQNHLAQQGLIIFTSHQAGILPATKTVELF